MESPRSFQELLLRYRQGERDFAEAELDEDADNDLHGVQLDGIDLSRSYVIADFTGASLRGARFTSANMKTCDFRGANLEGADFRGALVCSAQFDGAKLDGANFLGASAYGYKFKEGENPNG